MQWGWVMREQSVRRGFQNEFKVEHESIVAISNPYDLAPAETAKDLAPDFGSKDNRIYQI